MRQDKNVKQKAGADMAVIDQANWKAEAERLFFDFRLSISDVAAEIKISRQSVSAYLHTCPGYEDERNRRIEENAERRREYKREWNQKQSAEQRYQEGRSLLREHETAVRILSSERFFHE